MIPPFSQGVVICDNAFGSVAVTETIIALPPPGIKIHATEIKSQYIQGVAALTVKNNWLITSFSFHYFGDHDAAAKQVYHTLQPGSTATAPIWIFMARADAIQHAHWRTSGKDGPIPILLPLEGFQEADVRRALVTGEFHSEISPFQTRAATSAFLTSSDGNS